MRGLAVENLTASVQGVEILKGLNLDVPAGELHAVMGPNGSGKSTLCHVLTGKADYTVGGSASVHGHNVLTMDVDERARLGQLGGAAGAGSVRSTGAARPSWLTSRCGVRSIRRLGWPLLRRRREAR